MRRRRCKLSGLKPRLRNRSLRQPALYTPPSRPFARRGCATAASNSPQSSITNNPMETLICLDGESSRAGGKLDGLYDKTRVFRTCQRYLSSVLELEPDDVARRAPFVGWGAFGFPGCARIKMFSWRTIGCARGWSAQFASR